MPTGAVFLPCVRSVAASSHAMDRSEQDKVSLHFSIVLVKKCLGMGEGTNIS